MAVSQQTQHQVPWSRVTQQDAVVIVINNTFDFQAILYMKICTVMKVSICTMVHETSGITYCPYVYLCGLFISCRYINCNIKVLFVRICVIMCTHFTVYCCMTINNRGKPKISLNIQFLYVCFFICYKRFSKLLNV